MEVLIFFLVSIGLIILAKFFRWRNRLKKLKIIRSSWGTIPEDVFDVTTAKLFFELNKTDFIENSYQLDESTWNDLDMNEIFKLTNRAITPVGAQYLYCFLRQPVLSRQTLENREKLFDLFSNNSELRDNIQLFLLPLQEKNAKYLPYSLWKPLPEKPVYTNLLPFFSLLAFLVVLFSGLKVIHFGFIIIVFVINFFIRLFIKKQIHPFIYSFQYLGILINVADKISTIKSDALKDVQKQLTERLRNTKSIADKIFSLQFNDEDVLIEYFNSYFLLDVAGFYSALNKIKNHLDDLRAIFKAVGYLDAVVSISSFRHEYQNFSLPSFSKNQNIFQVKEIYHPLLQQPVSNNFLFISKDVLITGSNMAGKTTFLKTIGVNSILAQTIHTCMAKKYEAPILKVISSIGRSDNLLDGKSYYLAEVESILKLVNASESPKVHLFLIDEIFRGTNSIERSASSIEVLEYLANDKDFVFVATHDLQLSEVLQSEYDNYHFRERIDKDGLFFDYKLHEGPSTTKNAIALLDYAGYPKIITSGARSRIKN
jgi:DNA mismatch repair ATPase MutS